MTLHLVKAFGVSPLKRIDRLLFVAHRKDRARQITRTGTGQKLFRQGADHIPLVGARVLRFVNQHMVDTAVELVEHPRGHRVDFQHFAGAGNHVFIVKKSAGAFGLGKAFENFDREPQNRFARFGHINRFQIARMTEDAGLFLAQTFIEIGIFLTQFLGHEVFARIAVGFQKYRDIIIMQRRSGFLGGQHRRKHGSIFLVCLQTCFHTLRRIFQNGPRKDFAFEKIRLGAVHRLVGTNLQHITKPRRDAFDRAIGFDEPVKGAALARDVGQQFIECRLVNPRHHKGERLPERACLLSARHRQHIVTHLPQ